MTLEAAINQLYDLEWLTTDDAKRVDPAVLKDPNNVIVVKFTFSEEAHFYLCSSSHIVPKIYVPVQLKPSDIPAARAALLEARIAALTNGRESYGDEIMFLRAKYVKLVISSGELTTPKRDLPYFAHLYLRLRPSQATFIFDTRSHHKEQITSSAAVAAPEAPPSRSASSLLDDALSEGVFDFGILGLPEDVDGLESLFGTSLEDLSRSRSTTPEVMVRTRSAPPPSKRARPTLR